MTTNVEVVEYQHCFAICAVELHGDALAFVFSRQLEDAPIPTDTGGWIFLSEWIETLGPQRGIVLKRQLDSPVVW